MTRALREDAFLGETHIVTGAAQGTGHAVARVLSEPEAMANTVAGIADPALSGYTTGQVFQANGGMHLA